MKTFIFLFLPVLASGCSGPKGESQNSKWRTNAINENTRSQSYLSDPVIVHDSIPFRFLPFAERVKRSEPFHQYGDLKLKRIQPMSYAYQHEKKGVVIREYYTGVLLWYSTNKPYSQPLKIEFYDPAKRLISSLDIKAMSPYSPDKYNIIDYGYPNRESISDPEDPDFDCIFDDLPKPDGYIVLNDAHVSPTGYVVAEHQLVGITDHVIVSWEETLVIYNLSGKVVNRITIPHDTRYPFVSSDGNFLALTYGGNSGDNPFDRCSAHFQIYDLRNNDLIINQKSKAYENYTRAVEREKADFLFLGYGIKSKYETIDFFDLKNRIKYTRTFIPEEWLEVTNDFTTYAEMMKKYPFIQEKF